MLAPFIRLLVLFCAVGAVAQPGVAQTEEAPPPVDPARLNDHYVIAPGAEPLFAEMLGSGATLPGGCRFGDGQIERTYVVATYACDGGSLVLELVHPDVAPPGGTRTERFAIIVKSGTPPAGLLDALAERIRAREGSFTWTNVLDAGGSRVRLSMIAAGLIGVVMVVFFALRRFAARRNRSA